MTTPQMNVPGYERLAEILQRAYDQASRGKGHERHANGEPFDKQVMQDGARRFGVGALLFQAFKKSEESQRLPHDRAMAEIYGAIVYLAGAAIRMEDEARAVAAIDTALRDITFPPVEPGQVVMCCGHPDLCASPCFHRPR